MVKSSQDSQVKAEFRRSERIQEVPGEAGFRSLTLQLSELPQQHVVGLVAESGVHRLIRMSPFDRKARPL